MLHPRSELIQLPFFVAPALSIPVALFGIWRRWIVSIIDALLHGAPGALATLKARVADFAAPPLSMLFDPAVRDARHARSPEADEGIAAFKEKRKPSWYL